ncbi:MAG: monooxygenase [Fimbriimonadaceae bacterium]
MNGLRVTLVTAGIAVFGAVPLVPGRATASAPGKRYYTFARDVAPILYTKCASCHHAGEVAPFSLTSYADAKAKAKTIAAVTAQKFMPPWQAVSKQQFANDRSLTPSQIATLKAWADSGAPAGDLASAPPAPKFTKGWQIGEPDFVGEPAKAYPVAAEGADEYRCFVIPTHFSSDRYVTDVELKPGSRKVVHHILVYLDTSGEARKMDGKDGKPGYVSFGGPGFDSVGTLGGWAPGLQPIAMPRGCGMWLPKGADIVLQVHYHKDGKPETDLSEIGLKFAKSPVDKMVRWESVGNVFLSLPAGARRSLVTADIQLSTPVTLLDVIPHMHLLGRDMRVTATLPDGSKRELIHVENYDFNWQTRYTYKQPIKLPKGTHIALVAHYDNSAANIHNPNSPPKTVHFGPQTTDEMCFAFFSFTLDDEHLIAGKHLGNQIAVPDKSDTFSMMFDALDKAHRGTIGVSQLTDFVRKYRLGENEFESGTFKPDRVAIGLLSAYGRHTKGEMLKSEFVKMALAFSN